MKWLGAGITSYNRLIVFDPKYFLLHLFCFFLRLVLGAGGLNHSMVWSPMCQANSSFLLNVSRICSLGWECKHSCSSSPEMASLLRGSQKNLRNLTPISSIFKGLLKGILNYNLQYNGCHSQTVVIKLLDKFLSLRCSDRPIAGQFQGSLLVQTLGCISATEPSLAVTSN